MRTTIVDWSGGLPGYGDARWDGRYAVLVPGSHVETDTGRVPLPGGDGRFLRLANTGPRFACGVQRDASAWEWNGTAWSKVGTVCGNNPVIYDASNALVLAKCDALTGSLGWRYVREDGRLIAAYLTYADPKRGIWEYTEYSDVAIGQGAEAGVAIRFSDEAFVRMLTVPGVLAATDDTRFVRVSRSGEQLALTAVCLKQTKTVLWWGTLAELRAMPRAVTSTPTTPPMPTPIPLAAPKLEVDRFDGKIVKGKEWRLHAHDEANPDIRIEAWITPEGSVHFRLTHRGGTAKTSRFRPVF